MKEKLLKSSIMNKFKVIENNNINVSASANMEKWHLLKGLDNVFEYFVWNVWNNYKQSGDIVSFYPHILFDSKMIDT